ncbi:MAG: YceI family protein [Planctomycetes bacterium]|nr:YceI family protein [Planctomycetota bacterium]
MRFLTILALGVTLGLAADSMARADTVAYHVGHDPKFVNIGFESEAEFETIIGTTNQARGRIDGDLAHGTGSVQLSVGVASLRTGIEMRDETLRAPAWLDATQFPEIGFVSKKVEPAPDRKDAVRVTGDFTMHGVSRELTVTVSWKAIPAEAAARAGFPAGEWLKVSTEFDVSLSAHGVKLPAIAIGKVSDTWRVKLALFAGTAEPEHK